jgi:H+/Cl- antiporter ClcA
MTDDPAPAPIRDASTTGGLPVAPSLGPGLASLHVPRERAGVDTRTITVGLTSILLGIAAALIAQVLQGLIGLITNVSFYGRLSTAFSSPADHHLGAFVLAIPVIGGLIVGVMARYGSKAIRGHGIPEAMEQVLTNQSRIPPRLTFLKPLSAAVAIGTGGPFGAEGPIIATGGALGSLVGQLMRVTVDERKTLLAAGAGAGMAATFGAPVSAVLLAVELLLFELRPRSLLPVALATCAATGMRALFHGTGPMFAMSEIARPGAAALAMYVLLGAALGVVAVLVTRAVYGLEDLFEHLPVHWMWWPAIGAVVVGAMGLVSPHTLGVGYDRIDAILSGDLTGRALLAFVLFKFISWWVSLSSGTSGGTLAPLFMIGGGLGAATTAALDHVAPGLGLDPRVGALVGMAALFSGASRATLASVVFAFEVTRQPFGLLPLLGACAASTLVSSLLMRTSLMTEKIVRRGVRVPDEYAADALDRAHVRDRMTRDPVTLPADRPAAEVRAWLASDDPAARHQGFPVVDAAGRVIGLVTWRDLLLPGAPDDARVGALVRRPPVVCFEGHTLRDAADHMVEAGVGRLVVVAPDRPEVAIGIITRKDILEAHRQRLSEAQEVHRALELRDLVRRRAAPPAA